MASIGTPELVYALSKQVIGRLSRARARHVFSVAATAHVLCLRHDLEPARGSVAGLLHDLARETPVSDLRAFVRSKGYEPSAEECADPILLHGPASALEGQIEFGIDDPDILDAVFHHTTGRRGWTPLGKVLYVADYSEPFRGPFAARLVRRFATSGLDELVRAVVDRKLKDGHILAERTMDMYGEVCGRRP